MWGSNRNSIITVCTLLVFLNSTERDHSYKKGCHKLNACTSTVPICFAVIGREKEPDSGVLYELANQNIWESNLPEHCIFSLKEAECKRFCNTFWLLRRTEYHIQSHIFGWMAEGFKGGPEKALKLFFVQRR